MLFHDGYRRIYSNANETMISNPSLPYGLAGKKGLDRLAQEFHSKVDFMNERNVAVEIGDDGFNYTV